MKIRPVRLTIAHLQQEILGNPNLKITELQYLTFYRVTVLQHLTFYSEKVVNHYLFSKAEGQINQSRLFHAFVNVHYVNVKPLIFDVMAV